MSDETKKSAAPPVRGPTGAGDDRKAERLPSHVPDQSREESPERHDDRREPGTRAAAGPHSQPSLTNPDATPGAGTLPDPGPEGTADTDAGTG